jgi:hypothetical protein|tara:strand:- start:169 stop:357 length:189 start_codon:yes stop_codon:yes gene_type:complete
VIVEVEKLMTKIHRVKKLAEGGLYITKDEMGRNNFELIIRELGDFQEWQKHNRDKLDKIKNG